LRKPAPGFDHAPDTPHRGAARNFGQQSIEESGHGIPSLFASTVSKGITLKSW
jgi:hypothetical protein